MRHPAAAALPVLAVLAGCTQSPFGPGDTGWEPALERLSSIEGTRFESMQAAPPRSVAEELAAIDERLAELDALAETGPVDEGRPVARLGLADVRAAALEGNLDLRVQQLEPELAATSVSEEEARFEATFTAAILHARSDRPVVLGTEGSQGESTRLDLGLDVPLRTGGTASVSLPIVESETDNPFSLLNPAYTADLTLSISQPLLRGAGTGPATYALRVAQVQSDASAARARLEAIRVLAEADRAYWRLYAAQRALEVALQQYALAREQEGRARRRVEAGDAAEIEIIRSEAGTAQRLETIITAISEAERLARDLKRLVQRDDLPLDGDAQLVLATEPSPQGLRLDARRLADYAVANRMEMLALEYELAIDALTVDLRRNETLPGLVLDYAYNVRGLGGTYNDAFDQLPPRTFDDWSARLGLDLPLGNEAAESRLDRALLTRVQRLRTKSAREASIRQEVLDAATALERSWQRILAARYDVRLASATFEAEQRQFDVGARTSTDVLDAAARLAEAQVSEIQAVVDHEIAQVDVAFATGTLLGSSRVRWVGGDDETSPDPSATDEG